MKPGPVTSMDDLSPEERELLAHLLGESSAPADQPPVPRADRTRAPLSFAQRRLWVAEQLRPGDPAYHLWVAFRVSGVLDRSALARSLAEIVRRHEVLRSTVEVVEGVPYQRVHDPADVTLPVIDLGAVQPESRDDHVVRAIRAQVDRPFDLSNGPLLRASLLLLEPHEHVLVLVMHHIVTDGWSMGVLFRELGALYEAFRSGRPSPLEPPSLQYGDVVEWQVQRLDGDALDASIAAWRRELAGAHATRLEGGRAGGVPDSAGADELAVLGLDLSGRIDALARREGATRFIVLLAAFSVLLARYSAERDVLLGMAAAGRTRAELEPLIGFFVNMLPLRADIDPRATFRQTLRQVRQQAVAALDRQDLPFDRLVDALGIERTLDRHPLFQIVFTAQDALLQPLVLADLVLTPLELRATATRFDLEAHVLDAHDGVRLGFVYSARRFEARAIRRMLDHYVALIDACVTRPDEPLDLLPWVDEDERRALMAMSRGRAGAALPGDTVVARVQAQVSRRPGADAVVCGHDRLSYRALDDRAARVAGWLRDHGVRRGDRVGVLLDRTVDFVVAVWAAFKAGAAYVPLDPSYPDDRLAYMAEDSGMSVAVTHDALRARLAGGVQSLCLDADAASLEATPPAAGLSGVEPGDLAYVVYTSGSTGRPKGVEVTHAALANLVRWHLREFAVTADDRATQVASVGFDACVWEVWPYLAAGARLCVADEDTRTVPERLWRWLRDESVTIAFLPTPLAEAALREGVPGGLKLRTLLTGGDRLTLQPSPGWPFVLVNNYGPTENAVVSTSGVVPVADAGPAPSIGSPIDDAQTYVLDASMQPVPVGVIGELYVGGRSLARGYLGRRAQTAVSFVPDPFGGEPGARLYRTGDLVRWRPDGTLDFIGRRDGQVKVRGFRIELGEVEAALARVPGVEAAVAIVHGAGEQRRIVGYVVSAPGAPMAGDEVRARVKPWLPPYMVPAVVMIVPALPLTAHGKVDRSALPPPVFEDAGGGAEPRTPVEAALQRVWCEVLGVERVGVHDNFFDVGGDSILSIQIASRATQAGLPLSPRLFFEHQTIAELAAHVAGPAGGGAAGRAADARRVDEEAPVTGDVPLTPIQHWFFEQDLAQPHHFNQAVLLELRQPFDDQAVGSAVDALARHHDALRARFAVVPGGIAQRVSAPAAGETLSIVDLSSRAESERPEAVTAECARVQASLDLARGPLFRAVLFHVGGRQPDRLLLVAHHLVVDGVSWRILLEDLRTALEAAAHGSAVHLPAKTTSFKTWAAGLHQYLASGVAGGTREFWRQQAQGFEPLPLDGAGPEAANTVGSSARISVRFSREETEALLRTVPAATRCRINEVLLASIVGTLARWSGRRSVHVDVEGHGREAVLPGADLSRTVGWFTSIHPVRFDVHGSNALDRRMASDVAARLRSVPRGGLDCGVLRYLDPGDGRREVLASAEPEISFNYLGQFDEASGSDAFALAPEDVGPSIAPANRRRHLLEVNARVSGGVLDVDWTYSPSRHARDTVAALAESSARALRTFVSELSGEPARGPRHVDRLLADLDGDTLEALVRSYEEPGLDDVYPLGPLQLGMVVHALGAPGTGLFVSQFELVLDAGVDAAAMRTAWAVLQARHPILRTAFVEAGGGEFRQIVLGRPALAWHYEDWSDLTDGDARARYDAFREQDRLRGFAPGEVPLRVTLLQLRHGRAHLFWTHHHALLDGWSVAMLLDELFRIHDAAREDREAVLEPRPPYRRYIEWLQAQDPVRTEAFWRAHLAGTSAPTVLASDRGPAPYGQGGPRLEERELFVESAATRAIGEFAVRHRLTLNAVVQGAWALLLSRHSGEETVVFGTAVSGRPADLDGVERMVGLFLNGLPMRVDVPGEASVHEWLAGMQARHADLRQHQHAALSDIQRWSDVPSGQPLFEATIAFENYPISPTLSEAARRLGVVDFRLTAHTSAALHLRVIPGDRLRLMLAFDATRFDPAMAEAMLGQLDSILRQMYQRPAGRVAAIALAAVDFEPARPAGGGAAPRAVHEDILEAAARHPERPALEMAADVCSYGALERRSRSLAHALDAAGVRTGDVVGVYLPRGIDLVVSLVGVLRAGAAFAILDPGYPAPRTLERLQAAGIHHVLASAPDGRFAPILEEWRSGGDGRELVALSADHGFADAGAATCMPAAPDDVAYVSFTSGSTGRPKAVLGRHGALAAYGPWLAGEFGVGAGDRFAMLTALSHDPLLRDVFPALQQGATIVVPPADVFDRPGALAAWAASAGVTVVNLTPSMAQLMMEGSPAPIESLRLAFFVGEPLTRALVERFGTFAPRASVVNLYGATETQQSLGWHLVPSRPAATDRATLPAGRGMPGVELLVVRDGGHLAGIGEVGEIWVRSAHLAGGYVGDPALTDSRFVTDPFGPGSGRAYRTGDRGWRLPSGDVSVVGRADEQIKVRGFRVEPGEIETHLLREAGVRAAAAVVVPRGDGGTFLMAYIAGAADGAALLQRLRQELPPHLVPSRVVALERLPHTATGKIDRRALARLAQQAADGDGYVPPSTPTEARVADLMAEVLQVDRVGAHDGFFELGGHSILAARLAARLRDALAVEVQIPDVFIHPRVADLAAMLDARVADRDAVGSLLDELADLPEEELRALLEGSGSPDDGPTA